MIVKKHNKDCPVTLDIFLRLPEQVAATSL